MPFAVKPNAVPTDNLAKIFTNFDRRKNMEQIRERFASYLEAVGEGLLEREEAVRITVLAAIAGHNTFLLGEPGIGKSLLCRKL